MTMTTQNWNLDTAHSAIGFSVRHMVVAKVRGRFGSWSGQLDFDPEDLVKSRVSVEIEATSIDTGVADRDAHLKSPDFLDAESFPTLSFRSTRVESTGGNQYRIFGELTIRDVTKEVVLDAVYADAGKDPWGNERVAFSASTSVNRKDYGLTWNQALEAGGVLVGDKVEIDIEVQAVNGGDAE
jgi:polyisoprenoid-binding protein YceI